MTKDTDGYLITKIILSPTYRVDERPRIPTGTWSRKSYFVLVMGRMDDQEYRRALGPKNCTKFYI